MGRERVVGGSRFRPLQRFPARWPELRPSAIHLLITIAFEAWGTNDRSADSGSHFLSVQLFIPLTPVLGFAVPRSLNRGASILPDFRLDTGKRNRGWKPVLFSSPIHAGQVTYKSPEPRYQIHCASYWYNDQSEAHAGSNPRYCPGPRGNPWEVLSGESERIARKPSSLDFNSIFPGSRSPEDLISIFRPAEANSKVSDYENNPNLASMARVGHPF